MFTYFSSFQYLQEKLVLPGDFRSKEKDVKSYETSAQTLGPRHLSAALSHGGTWPNLIKANQPIALYVESALRWFPCG